MKIKEAIIVEGKDDIAAVKKAVDAEVIATNGIRISNETLESIQNINDRCGIIIFTDPDYTGERIREKLSSICPGAKHAFINKNDATRDKDIGVENALPGQIQESIKNARPELVEREEKFTKNYLAEKGLIGGDDSKRRRQILTDILAIGYCNGKQLINRLNSFGISEEELVSAIEEMEEKING